MMSCWFSVFFNSAKAGCVEVGADGNGASKGLGVKTECRVEIFVEIGITSNDKALRLFRGVDEPSGGVVWETKEDSAGRTLKLLFVSDETFVVVGVVLFEEGGAAKNTKVGEAGLLTIAEFKGSDGYSVSRGDILCRTCISDMNGVGVGVMKEGSTKVDCVEKNIGCVVNFTPFCFAEIIHFLMFWSCGFKFHSKVFAFGDEVCRCEC